MAEDNVPLRRLPAPTSASGSSGHLADNLMTPSAQDSSAWVLELRPLSSSRCRRSLSHCPTSPYTANLRCPIPRTFSNRRRSRGLTEVVELSRVSSPLFGPGACVDVPLALQISVPLSICAWSTTFLLSWDGCVCVSFNSQPHNEPLV